MTQTTATTEALVGTKIGRLLVKEWLPTRNKHGKSQMLCVCECGKERTVSVASLRQGHTRSCGCLQRDVTIARSTKHGGVHSATYTSWRAMKERCGNPNNSKYSEYGGRGIRVCERWLKFENFLADMGERPIGTTLDRFPNNDGDYGHGNCRWATRREQANNRRTRKDARS